MNLLLIKKRDSRNGSEGSMANCKRHWEYVGKLENTLATLLDMFHESDMILWTPDKQFYSWQLVTTSKAEKMLKARLEELLTDRQRGVVTTKLGQEVKT